MLCIVPPEIAHSSNVVKCSIIIKVIILVMTGSIVIAIYHNHHDYYSRNHVYHQFDHSSKLVRRKVRIICFSISIGSAHQISAPLNFVFFTY